MKKSTSAGKSKILILLIGLVLMAVLVLGVVWSTRFMPHDVPVAQAPAVTRMKIPQPPQISPSGPPAQPVRLQPSDAPPATTALPLATLPQKPAGPVTSQVLAAQVDAPADKPISAEHDRAAPHWPAPVTREAPLLQDATSDTPALKDTPQPTAPATDAPAGAASTQKEPGEGQPEKDPSADAARPANTLAAADAEAETVHFNLQVGAFRVEAYARETMAKLLKRGYTPFILEITDARQRTWYTVRIGRYDNRQKAVSSLARFKRKENLAAVIARSDKL